MRDLFKIFMVTTLVLTVSSCGKDNKTGGGSNTPPPVVNPGVNPGSSNWYGSHSNDPANANNYNTLRNYYQNQSFKAGVTANLVIYHIGPSFNGDSIYNQSNLSGMFDFDFDAYYCFNFFGYQKGNCSQNQYTPYQANYESLLRKGEYKVLINADANMTQYNNAISATNNGFNFETLTFNRDDIIYRKMLNLDANPVLRTVISKANVKAVKIDGSGNTSNIDLKADYVEYFFTDGTIEGYIISPEIPMIANPVAITESNSSDTHALVGALQISGSLRIVSIAVDIHNLEQDPFSSTYTYKERKIGERSIIFNQNF